MLMFSYCKTPHEVQSCHPTHARAQEMPPKFSNGLLDPKSTLRKRPADFCLTKVQRRAGGEFREREGTLLELSRGLLAPRGILGSWSLELGASQRELGGVVRSSYAFSFRRVLIRSGVMHCHFGGFSLALVLCICHFGGFSSAWVLRFVISEGSHLYLYYPLSFGQFLNNMIVTQGGPLTPAGNLGNGVPETTKAQRRAEPLKLVRGGS
jgi:hypothetical protein